MERAAKVAGLTRVTVCVTLLAKKNLLTVCVRGYAGNVLRLKGGTSALRCVAKPSLLYLECLCNSFQETVNPPLILLVHSLQSPEYILMRSDSEVEGSSDVMHDTYLSATSLQAGDPALE
jgi:hypothetical protein